MLDGRAANVVTSTKSFFRSCSYVLQDLSDALGKVVEHPCFTWGGMRSEKGGGIEAWGGFCREGR